MKISGKQQLRRLLKGQIPETNCLNFNQTPIHGMPSGATYDSLHDKKKVYCLDLIVRLFASLADKPAIKLANPQNYIKNINDINNSSFKFCKHNKKLSFSMFSNPPSRFNRYYLLLSYFCLSCIPLITPDARKRNSAPRRLLAYQIFSWFLLWLIGKSPRWFHFALIPAFPAAPIEIYLRLYYNQKAYPAITLGSSPRPVHARRSEFLGNKIWLLVAIIVGIVVWWTSLYERHGAVQNWHGMVARAGG